MSKFSGLRFRNGLLWIVKGTFVTCLFATSASSQNHLWGTLPFGGKGAGMIYNVKTDGSDFKVSKVFNIEMQRPLAYMTDGGNSYFYGVAHTGDAPTGGVLYRVSANGNDFSIIHEFSDELPGGGVVLLNGLLYGTTFANGPLKRGMVYSIALDGSNFQSVYNFPSVIGPNGGLLKGSDNNLYGTTSSGGASGTGTVFKINLSNNGYTTLYQFETFGGANPNGSLIEGVDGFLYGTTSSGSGAPVGGSLFSLSKTGTNFKTIRSFAEFSKGFDIYGSVTESTDGKLFGTFNHGGANGKGGIYKVDKNGSNYQVAYSFKGIDGEYPGGNLVLRDGYWYGATNSGGANGRGVIYKLSEDGTSFTKILDLKRQDGYGVYLFASNSKLYYSSYSGGLSGFGAIGQLDLENKKTIIIKDFNPLEGGMPTGKLLYHSNGYLYGTTSKGGTSGNGVLFKIDPVSENYDVVYNFKEDTVCCTGSIMETIDGDIKGVADFSGGSQLFTFDVGENKLTKVFNVVDRKVSTIWEGIETDIFGNVSDAAGNINKLFRTDSIKSKLRDVDYMSGSGSPWLTVDTDTATFMLGITRGNPGSNKGQIISYDYKKNSLNTFYNFNNTSFGVGPTGELTPLKNGQVFGVTSYGGASSGGTIFAIDVKAHEFSKVFDFPAVSYPISIERVSDELFYGVLFENGSPKSNSGAVYKYSTSEGFSVIKNFEDINGYYASHGLTKVVKDEATIKVYGDDLDFGTILVEDTVVKYLHIRNFGHTALEVSNISLPVGFFADEITFTINPGETRLTKIFFAPEADTLYSGALKIISNAETGNYKLPISGSGYIIIAGVENEPENSIDIYPNPARRELQVTSSSTIESVKIVNLLGSCVVEEMNINKHEHVFNLGNHTQGIHIVVVTDSQGRVTRKKILLEGSN